MKRAAVFTLLAALFACVAVSHAAEREFYWNQVSNATQWEEPAVPVPYQDEESGKQFYVDPKTGESTWDFPGKWKKFHSEDHGIDFYHNEETQESTWDMPEDLAWVRVKHDDTEL